MGVCEATWQFYLDHATQGWQARELPHASVLSKNISHDPSHHTYPFHLWPRNFLSISLTDVICLTWHLKGMNLMQLMNQLLPHTKHCKRISCSKYPCACCQRSLYGGMYWPQRTPLFVECLELISSGWLRLADELPTVFVHHPLYLLQDHICCSNGILAILRGGRVSCIDLL